MRLFISIPLPENVRKVLAEVKRDFLELPAKWVEEENLHLTLIFIGETDKASEITNVLDSIKYKPMNLETSILTLFPSEEKARLLAVNLAGKVEKISSLVEEIKKKLLERKIGFDEKPFHSHITLARLKQLRSGEKEALRQRIRSYTLPKIGFEATQIDLVESRLTPAGPVYKALKNYVLPNPSRKSSSNSPALLSL